MAEHVLTESGIYGMRLMAAELIQEATERGDLDHCTVTWAANRMLQRANNSEDMNERKQRRAGRDIRLLLDRGRLPDQPRRHPNPPHARERRREGCQRLRLPWLGDDGPRSWLPPAPRGRPVTRAGGCPTATTCRWGTHPESASWRLCGTCGVERPAPGVDVAALGSVAVREPAESAASVRMDPSANDGITRALRGGMGEDR